MKKLNTFVIAVALIAGIVGCVGGDGDNGGEPYTLIVDFTAGGTVTVDDLPIPGKAILTYGAGTEVSVSANPSTGYRFVEWTGNVTTVADVNAATTTITMDDDYSISANFIAQYVLTIYSTDGGEVIIPGQGIFVYDDGAAVDLVAEPDEGYVFINWTGDVGTIADVNAAITSMSMNGNCSVTANFAEYKPLASTSWPKYKCDAANTGRGLGPGIRDVEFGWSYQTGPANAQGIRSSPVIGVDGTVYFGAGDGRLYAINPDGTLNWVCTTWGFISSKGPAIGFDGTIYVGSVFVYPDSMLARLYAIRADGTVMWYFTADCPSSYYGAFSPTIGLDGTIYAGADKLYAINQDGTLKWSYDTGSVVVTPALASDGVIYVLSASDGRLYAVNPDGTLRWSYQTEATDVANLWSSPAVGSDGTVYFGTTGDNKLYAINPNGSLKWTFQANGWIRVSPVIGSNGTIYFGDDAESYGVGERPTFYAINPDGTLKWSYRLYFHQPVGIHTASLASDDTIYFAVGGSLHVLNPDGSGAGWRLEGSQKGYGPAIGANGEIYWAASYGSSEWLSMYHETVIPG